jgi:nitrite reductase (NADH) small subunit
MQTDLTTQSWTAVCDLDDILPDTGVCALLDGAQVAIFRVGANDAVYAIGNVDPQSGAAVLARGLVGNLGARVVVASPLYKQHFDLRTGECIEAPAQNVPAYAARVDGGTVWVSA